MPLFTILSIKDRTHSGSRFMPHPSLYPYGKALLDYMKGLREEDLVVEREDGYRDKIPVSFFFRKESECPPCELRALDLCRGHVLDIGAGAGSHSLALQNRGLTVTALDILPEAAEVMRQRGVRDIHCGDILDFQGAYSTLLLSGRSIGMAGSLEKIESLLRHFQSLVLPGGQCLIDSLDVSETMDTRHPAYHQANKAAGRYPGEVQMRFIYRREEGAFFTWIHVDETALMQAAEKTGWFGDVVMRDETGPYLACLTRYADQPDYP